MIIVREKRPLQLESSISTYSVTVCSLELRFISSRIKQGIYDMSHVESLKVIFERTRKCVNYLFPVLR